MNPPSIEPGAFFFPRTASEHRATHAPLPNSVISGVIPTLPMTTTELTLRTSQSTVGGAGDDPCWPKAGPEGDAGA